LSGAGFKLALGLIGVLAFCAIAAPWLGLRDPNEQLDGLVLPELAPLTRVDAVELVDGTLRFATELREADGAVELLRGPRWDRIALADLRGGTLDAAHRRPWFVLGTDGFGRDVLARLVYGARVSLLVGFLAAGMALGLGTLVGTAAGLAGGWIDGLLMRLTDVVLSVPRLFLAVLLVALYGRSLTTTILVLGATSWMAAARLVRGEILSLRERDYVQAARAAGAAAPRLAWLHLLPSAMLPLIVEGVLRVGDTILIEASLSFLGLGVPPPDPTWGNMIAEGRDRLLDAWWIATLPGFAIVATVFALHLFGEAARKRLNPAT
jgi:peptide/nickel transport system permease protein